VATNLKNLFNALTNSFKELGLNLKNLNLKTIGGDSHMLMPIIYQEYIQDFN